MTSKPSIQNYQQLAAAIVKVAASDYVEALIVINSGGILTAQQRSNAKKKRAMFKDKKQGEKAMRMYIAHCKLVNLAKAEYEATSNESFFRSADFAILMPNTDPNKFIELLRQKAEANEAIDTGYGSFLKSRGGWADD